MEMRKLPRIVSLMKLTQIHSMTVDGSMLLIEGVVGDARWSLRGCESGWLVVELLQVSVEDFLKEFFSRSLR